MQKVGNVHYLRDHNKAVKGITFSPKDRFIFASGASDGRINIYGTYHSFYHYLLVSYPTIDREIINGVQFNTDGNKILAALSSKKVVLYDIQKGHLSICYEDSCFNSRDRIPIATDPLSPHLAVTLCTNGKGITLFDLRMPLPFDFLHDLHQTEIRDIIFINNSWPFVPKEQKGIVTLSYDGICKVVTLDKKILHQFDVGHNTNSMASTPETFNSCANDGFRSLIMLGGESLSTYVPDISNSYEKISLRSLGLISNSSSSTSSFGIQDYMNSLNFNLNLSNFNTINDFNSSNPLNIISTNNLIQQNHRKSNIQTMQVQNTITQLKYGSNGGILYAACSDGKLKRYRRYSTEHRLIDEKLTHKSEIYNIAISPYDEYLVSASRDKTIGVMYLGAPNHGSTNCYELT